MEFSLAIFVGQITAALVAGNNVIVNLVGDISIIAYEVIKIFHNAGIPKEALQLVIADKEVSDELKIKLVKWNSVYRIK